MIFSNVRETTPTSGGDVEPSHHRMNDTSTTAATTASTVNSSGYNNGNSNTNATLLTNTGTIIRSQPSTTMTSNPPRITDDSREMPLDQHVLPHWTPPESTADKLYNKDTIHYRNKNSTKLNPTTNNNSFVDTTTNPISHTNQRNTSNDNNETTRYPVREIQFYIHGLQDPIVINPMVSLYAIVLLWSMVIWTTGTLRLVYLLPPQSLQFIDG
jgi:hypothetical protein